MRGAADVYLAAHQKHAPGTGHGHGAHSVHMHKHGAHSNHSSEKSEKGHDRDDGHNADVLPHTTVDIHSKSSGVLSCFPRDSKIGSGCSPDRCCNRNVEKTNMLNLAEELKSLAAKNTVTLSKNHKKLPQGSVIAAGLHGDPGSEIQEDSILALWTPHDPEANEGVLTKSPDCILEHHKSRVLCLAADREWAISGSENGELHYWDLTNRRLMGTLYGHEGHAQGIVADFTRNWAVSCSGDRSMMIWDLKTLLPLHTILDATVVLGLSADFGMQRAATTGHDGRLKVWNISTDLDRNKEIKKELHDMEQHTAGISNVGHGDQSVMSIDVQKVRATNTGQNDANQSSEHLLCDLEGHDDHALDLEACFFEAKALTASRNGTLRFWDVAKQTCVEEFEGHEHPVHSVSADFKTHKALSASADATLKIWDLKCREKCVGILKEHDSKVNAISADFEQHRAVSGSNDRSVKEWDFRMMRCIRTLGGFNHGVQAVCLL